jgi:hypothetical protein
MKAAVFWILMFCLLALLAIMTMNTNPQRSKYRHPAEESQPPTAESSETHEKTWSKVYAELYGPKGLERTWEIATPKGYFTQADRDQFLRDIPAKKQFGEAQVTAKEDGDDLVFSIYYKGAKP